MKKNLLLFPLMLFASLAFAQKENLPKTSAGFPVNYEEDSVGEYLLPDPMVFLNGQRVKTTEEWTSKRRPEIIQMLESIEYGKAPAPPAAMHFLLEEQGVAFAGKAIRKQVTVYFTEDTSKYKMALLIYLPTSIPKPAPIICHISFTPNNLVVDDPAVKMGYLWTKEGKRLPADKPSRFPKMNVEQIIDAGIGFACVYYGDIEPDFKDGYKFGIRGKYALPAQTYPAKDAWGAIAAWSWGLSRAMDYFKTDAQIDQHRVALQGASRLGKTVLWAGAKDTRFKMVIASVSGEGGAALAKRNYGENIQHITDTSRYYYQFAPNYHHYGARPGELPFDAHFLVALMAPRPLLLQTGDTDYWSDPHGEFLSAVAAAPVYFLFGRSAPAQNAAWPAAGDTSLLMNTLGYYMHKGGHGVFPDDWKLFIAYMKKHL